ncbi:uncharacterized protein BP01DRAFT_279255, partial [Aspergillus saccharolyticus JOP 1030-1]
LSQFKKASPAMKTILRTGDIAVEYLDSEPAAVPNRWRVSSNDLMRNSPYFRALLDPNKFAEGRDFMNQKIQRQRLPSQSAPEGLSPDDDNDPAFIADELPVVRLPSDHFTSRLGTDAIELFLEVLSFDSYDDEHQRLFGARLRVQPVSLVTRLVELADAFNSPEAVQKVLRQLPYAFGRGKIPLTKFDAALLLKLPEDQIRQTIFVARFLDQHAIVQVYTHALVVLGSRYWANGVVETPDTPTLPWRYLTGGIEEELYFRRQCVLNTITDLQAHFLRAYGALEEPTDEPYGSTASTPASTPTSTSSTATATATPQPRPPFSLPATSTTLHPRHFQCRYGFANSSACDAFHLGQMTRFFSLRAKTIFLGSTLIDDPDFLSLLDEENGKEEGEEEEEKDDAARDDQSPNRTNIVALLAALKQCPDYQIDSNHTGCGIRRRFLPPLDCIERFVGDARGLLGVAVGDSCSPKSSRSSGSRWPWGMSESWANRFRPRALVLDVHLSRVNAVPVWSKPRASANGGGCGGGGRISSSQEENARLLFTARRRNWEA